VDEETIRRYIESKQWEDPGENFKDCRAEQALSRRSAGQHSAGFSRKQATFSRHAIYKLSVGSC
jgi:hypothetical protein